MALLFNIIAVILLLLLSFVAPILIFLYFIYGIAIIIPGFALSIRRLHDLNKSGWWILLGLIPIVGGIILIIWYCFSSVDAGNRYGIQV